MRYSQLPMSSYIRKNDKGEEIGFGTYEYLKEPGVWNLFYLTEQLVSVSGDWPEDDIENMPRFSHMIYPCYLTCKVYPELAAALETLPAAEIIEMIKGMDYKAMPIHEEYESQWLQSMKDLADIIIPEYEEESPVRGVVAQEGNVLNVDFGRKV